MFLALFGCESSIYVKPSYMDEGFDRQNVSTITVLPVVDARIDKSYDVDLKRVIKASIAASLIVDKGYDIDFEEDIGSLSGIYIEDIQTHSKDWIERLGPEDTRWILLMAILDAKSEAGFGRSAAAEIQAFLFDKQQGRLVWKNHAASAGGHGGLGYLLMSEDAMLEVVVSDAVAKILYGMPPKEGPIPEETTTEVTDEI